MKKPFKLIENKNLKLFFLRLLLLWMLASVLFGMAGVQYARIFFPAFFYELRFTHPEYEIHNLGLGKDVISLDTTVHRNFLDENGKNWNGKRLQASIGTSDIYIYPIIVFSLLLAIPDVRIKKRITSLCIAIPLIYVAGLFDVPLRLAYQIEWLFAEATPAGQLRGFWQLFLMNGGRQFIALLIAVVSSYPHKLTTFLFLRCNSCCNS